MPRTIEGLVQCHQIARERARSGKPSWEGKLLFMSALAAMVERFEDGDDTLTPQMMLDGFQEATKEIRAKVPQAQGDIVSIDDQDLESFVLTIEQWTVSHIEASPDILEEFNEQLDRLYDWADVNRWRIAPP